MTRSEDISERFWSSPQKAEEEGRREQWFLDDVIQKAHLDREIQSRLVGVRTILDAGAGTGRFSIPLAREGFDVTHLDVSQSMIDAAREQARREGVESRMSFQRARLGDLVSYPDSRFDLVICCDAPLSYTYPDQDRMLSDIIRIAGKAVVVSVSSRLGYVPYVFNPLQKLQYLAEPESESPDVQAYRSVVALDSFEPDLDAAWRALRTGLLNDPVETEREYASGGAPWPHNYLFNAEELREGLARGGLSDVRLSGPGALSRSIPSPVLRRMLTDESRRERFLNICYAFDSHAAVCGLGKDNLVASGVRGK